MFERKADCDANFELLTRRLLEARPALRVAIASHNLRSVSHAIACNRLLGGEDSRPRAAGPARPRRRPRPRARVHGLRVRAYCPVGDLVAGMAYLVRRLLENTANESFLADQAHGVPLEQLLAPPGTGLTAGTSTLPPFANEPVLELRRAGERAKLTAALDALVAAAARPGLDRRRAPRRRPARSRPTRPRPSASSRVAARATAGRGRRAPSPPPAPPSRPGPPRRRTSAPPPSCAPRPGCASAAPRSRRWPCASARSRGRRPTPTSARRSTSSSSTRAARSTWPQGRRCCRCPASATTCATRRAASARSSPRGTSRSRSRWAWPRRRWRPATPSC